MHTLREAWMSLSGKASTRIFSVRSAGASSVSGAGSAFMPSFTLVAYSLKRRSRSEVAFVDCAASAGAAMAPSWPAPCDAALVRQPCQRALSADATLASTCLASLHSERLVGTLHYTRTPAWQACSTKTAASNCLGGQQRPTARQSCAGVGLQRGERRHKSCAVREGQT